MTKTAETNISINEILIIIYQRRRLITILAIIFALVIGGYGLFKDKYNKDEPRYTEKEYTQYEKDVENYLIYKEAQQSHASIIEKEYAQIYREQKNNPVFSVDPFRCEYEQIVIRFSDGRNYDKTIDNWIASADNNKLFGKSASRLSEYKDSIIFTSEEESEYEMQYDSDETTIQVISVEGIDSAMTADYLKTYLSKKAADNGLVVAGISSAHIRGMNNKVADYQRRCRDAVTSSYNALNNIASMKSVVKEPSLLSDSEGINKGRVFEFTLAGLFFGIIIGTLIALIQAFHKGCVISRRQFEDAFGLELLSDFSSGSESASEIMNANIEAMTGDGSRIAVYGNVETGIDGYAEKWSDVGNHTYYSVTDIFDDPEDIDKLQNADGIALCVRIGETRIDSIQKVIFKCCKLNKLIIGYILI